MVQIKPILRTLFEAKKSSASVEDRMDDIGIAFIPHGDIEVIKDLPYKMFERLFTMNSNFKGGMRRIEMKDAFIEMQDFDEFWRMYENIIVWRNYDGEA